LSGKIIEKTITVFLKYTQHKQNTTPHNTTQAK